MIAELMSGLIKANLAAAAAILLVLALRRPVRARFGARAAYGLWGAPLLAAAAILLPHPARQTPLPPVVAQAVAATEVFSATPAPTPPERTVRATPAQAAFAAWLTGALSVAGLLLVHQARFLASLGHLSREGGRLRRAQRPGVGPALVGVFRPWIVTPADFEARFGPAERELILAHEDVHLARGDAAANAIACAAQAACWFNPLVHLAARLVRIDQELACDAAVIDRFPDRRRAYAELLLKTQIATQPLPLGCHWPAGAVHPLKERIAMLKLPSPRLAARRLGLMTAATTALACAAGAWAAQPGHAGQPVPPAAPSAIPNNGHLEPEQAARLVGPGQSMLCKPDEKRELHNCRILGSPFAAIATAADVQREWPAAAKKAGLTGYVTLRCSPNHAKAMLDHCEGYHFGGAAERPELKAAFEQAAVRVISIIRLKANPGPDDATLPPAGFYTIEFNDHPHMPGGPPADPPVTRYPDFLPGPPKPAAAARTDAAPAARLQPASFAPAPAPTATLIPQPEWLEKPTLADLVAAYPAADKDELGGMAVLDCRFADDGRLTGCRVASETPPEDGFGAAALKLAPLFRARLLTPEGTKVAGSAVRIPFRFQGPHGAPAPALSGPATVTRPVWTEKPTAADIARLYPTEALRQHLSAQVVMNCRVGADGRLAECGIANVPAWLGKDLPESVAMDFGSATLQLAKLFRMQPRAADGTDTSGGLIHIPVRWQPPGQP
jgi:beta-lactamase regulating signal transducer with metallopeptidase domain